MKPWILMLLLSACQPPEASTCTSVCGFRLLGQGINDSCSDFQAAEGRALAAFRPWVSENPADPRTACERLRGWSTSRVTTDAGSWVSWGREVAGLTFCLGRIYVLDQRDWRDTALSHEILHLLDCPRENVDHTGWDTWRWAAIEEANR
jgi:hypothetical protein